MGIDTPPSIGKNYYFAMNLFIARKCYLLFILSWSTLLGVLSDIPSFNNPILKEVLVHHLRQKLNRGIGRGFKANFRRFAILGVAAGLLFGLITGTASAATVAASQNKGAPYISFTPYPTVNGKTITATVQVHGNGNLVIDGYLEVRVTKLNIGCAKVQNQRVGTGGYAPAIRTFTFICPGLTPAIVDSSEGIGVEGRLYQGELKRGLIFGGISFVKGAPITPFKYSDRARYAS